MIVYLGRYSIENYPAFKYFDVIIKIIIEY